jgi:hypothetical protein
MSSNKLFALLMISCAIFAVCAAVRQFLMKKIVESAGGNWDWQSPLKNVSEEKRALQVLPSSKLRRHLRLLNGVAVTSWLVGLAVLVMHTAAK